MDVAILTSEKRGTEGFIKLRNTIQTPDQNNKYRFACDDTWVEKVKELQTDLLGFQKGTPFSEIGM